MKTVKKSNIKTKNTNIHTYKYIFILNKKYFKFIQNINIVFFFS